jgi:hypothetical protein
MTDLRKIAALAALLAVLLPVPVHAARVSGSYLLYVCGTDANGKELTPGGHIACQAYISGILDYHNLIHSLGTSPSVDFCVPENVDLNVLQQIVIDYLLANKSEHEHFVASPGVALALFAAYPCGGKK